MVDVFRKSSDIDKITEDIITSNPKFIWLQIGDINKKLAKKATQQKYIINR